MAINFPDSPVIGQTFTSANRTWTYNGSAWVGDYSSTGNADTIDGIDSSQFLRSDTSDTMTGSLTITGDVGVGTSSTLGGAALYVNGGENKWGIFERSGKQLYINANWSAFDLYAQVAPKGTDNMGLSLSSKDNNPEYFFITTSGNVGIGSTTPSYKLDLFNNSTDAGSQIRVKNSYASVNAHATVNIDGYASSTLKFWRNGIEEWKLERVVNTDNLQLNAYGGAVSGGAGAGVVQHWDYDTGNVGIGTTNPSTKLQVNGTITATSYAGDGSNLTGISAGATGGGTDQVFYENDVIVNSSYTITTGKNAMTAGPIEIANGATVTIPDGSEWTIV